MIREQDFEHEHDGTRLQSVLVLPDGDGPFPGVLLIHEFTGLGESTLDHARALAAEGFAVLAADFYGSELRPATRDEAATAHRVFRDDRPFMRRRARACLDAIAQHSAVDESRLGALGFSFGGGAALELARTDAPIDCAVSIYGYLDTSHPAQAGDIRAQLLVVRVAEDPVVPEEQASDFEEEMNAAGAEWDMVLLRDVEHGFADVGNDCFDAPAASRVQDMIAGTLIETLRDR
jgi:dienelactone hydrolase